jgi:hypothetical protein
MLRRRSSVLERAAGMLGTLENPTEDHEADSLGGFDLSDDGPLVTDNPEEMESEEL